MIRVICWQLSRTGVRIYDKQTELTRWVDLTPVRRCLVQY